MWNWTFENKKNKKIIMKINLTSKWNRRKSIPTLWNVIWFCPENEGDSLSFTPYSDVFTRFIMDLLLNLHIYENIFP